MYLKINAPLVNLHGGGEAQAPYPRSEAFSIDPYQPGSYAKAPGTVFFGYSIQTANVMERNNLGNELIETGVTEGNALFDLNREMILAQWDKEQNVRQTIGIPWLSRIPWVGYLFGTTTTSREKIHVCLTVRAEILNTARPDGMEVGVLTKVGK